MTLIEKIISLGYEEKEAKSTIMAGLVLVNEETSIVQWKCLTMIPFALNKKKNE